MSCSVNWNGYYHTTKRQAANNDRPYFAILHAKQYLTVYKLIPMIIIIHQYTTLPYT